MDDALLIPFFGDDGKKSLTYDDFKAFLKVRFDSRSLFFSSFSRHSGRVCSTWTLLDMQVARTNFPVTCSQLRSPNRSSVPRNQSISHGTCRRCPSSCDRVRPWLCWSFSYPVCAGRLPKSDYVAFHTLMERAADVERAVKLTGSSGTVDRGNFLRAVRAATGVSFSPAAAEVLFQIFGRDGELDADMFFNTFRGRHTVKLAAVDVVCVVDVLFGKPDYGCVGRKNCKANRENICREDGVCDEVVCDGWYRGRYRCLCRVSD